MPMLDFCARHGIAPIVEEFPMSQANAAFDRLAISLEPIKLALGGNVYS